MVLRFILGLLCLSTIASATLNDVDKQFLVAKNILNNGGFENGKAAWDLQNNGGLTIVTSGSNLLTGKASGTWDASTINGLLGDNTTVPRGLYGKNGVAFCKFQVPSGTATHTLQVKYGGSPLVSQTITSSTTPVYTFVNFVFPSDTSVQLAIVSTAADEPMIVIDDCFMGDASEVNINAMTTVVTDWVSYTPVFTGFGTVSLTAAHYKIVGDTIKVKGFAKTGTAAAATPTIGLPSGFTINSGKLSGSKQVLLGSWTMANTTTAQLPNSARGGYPITYDSDSSTSVMLSQRVDLDNDGTNLVYVEQNYSAMTNNENNAGLVFEFEVPITGSNTQSAYRPDAIAFNWSGFHSNDCSFTRSSSSYGQYTGDASCTFTEQANSNMGTVTSTYNGALSLTPGISFQTTRATTYHVCANANYDADGNNVNLQMIEKTSGVTIVSGVYQQVTSGQFINMQMCGNLDVDSVQTTSIEIQCKAASGACALTPNGTSGDKTVQWSIFGISQQIPAPLLVNSVVTPLSGVIVFAAAKVSSGDVVSDETGDWINGDCTNASPGQATCNFQPGIFSAAPTCTCSPINNANSAQSCFLQAQASTSSVTFITNSAGSNTNLAFNIHCMGPK